MTSPAEITAEDFAEADRQIAAAKAEMKRAESARIDLVVRRWNCGPGTEVVCGGKRFLVVSVDGTFGGFKGKPWLTARRQKKDGSWSAAQQNIYRDWDLAPTPEQTGGD